MALCGGIVLEDALDLSSDRILNEYEYIYIYIYIYIYTLKNSEVVLFLSA